jgi:hypothetical protein
METNSIKERPILFSGAMVRALLAGTKTQTRRAIKNLEEDEELGYLFPKPKRLIQGKDDTGCCFTRNPANSSLLLETCPYGKVGERLWVRETFSYTLKNEVVFRATAEPDLARETQALIGWKPSIFMPRELCRLLLEITAVRCERVQAISEPDALAEGVDMRQPAYYELGGLHMIGDHNRGVEAFADVIGARAQFAFLINTVNHRTGPNQQGVWEANPWVWVVEFKVIDGKEVASA